MKGDSVLRKIIFSSAFLAILPAFLTILFTHPPVHKYTLSVKDSGKTNWQVFYDDLNSDSVSELISEGKGRPYFYIVVKDIDEGFYDQWNLKDSLSPYISNAFTGNFNKNRYKEIYVFTHNKDSLFLNINEFLDHKGFRKERIFVTRIGYMNEVVSVLYPAGFFDSDGDGNEELYFSISSAFHLGPRKLYRYDIAKNLLDSSEFTATICLFPQMADADGDNRPEIFGTMAASGNYNTNAAFSDSSTWFMVFDDKLQFKFQPVEFKGYVNSLQINSLRNNRFKGYILSHYKGGKDPTVPDSKILIYSEDGKIIKEKFNSELGLKGNPHLICIHGNDDGNDHVYVVGNKIEELNEKLEIVKEASVNLSIPFNSWQADIDGDGGNEILIFSQNEGLISVYNASLKKITELKYSLDGQTWSFSGIRDKNNDYKLYMYSESGGQFLTMKKNRLYYLSFLEYPGIYVLYLFFILLIKRINTFQVVEKESLNRRLVTLQLQGIKSQLDPHFTFNTLNSIASLIYLEDRHLAYDYMNKFTMLLRSLINDAERIYRSLAEELDFVRTYLELEKLRFGNKFIYEINISDDISEKEQVPKLVLHTFAENAIKHGLMSLQEGGMLKIGAVRNGDYLILTVEDNGIGRAKAEGMSTSTGKGIRLTGEFYDILNKLNRKPIKHFIFDLHNNNGESCGTRVEVWVPVNEDDKH